MNNRRGETLISVLIAMSIGLTVLYFVSTMIANTFKAQRAVHAKDASLELVSSIRNILKNPSVCASSFSGSAPAGAGFSKNQILDSSAIVKFQTGTDYLNNLVRLSSLEVKNYTADDIAIDPLTGKAELHIGTSKLGSTIGPEAMSNIIYLQTTLDASNNILSCFALGSSSTLWQISPFDSSDIYYSAGNVGIGTNAPQQKLDVSQGQIHSSIDNNWNVHRAKTFSNNVNHQSAFIAMRGRGTEATPAYPLAGDQMGELVARDVIDGESATYGGSFISSIATENFSATNKGTAMRFGTTADGANVPSVNMVLDQSGNLLLGSDNGAQVADGLGPRLYLGGKTVNNSDPMYFQRNHYAVDKSELRLVVGDNANSGPASDDQFSIGATDFTAGDTWFPHLTISSTTGNVGIGTNNPLRKLQVVQGNFSTSLDDGWGSHIASTFSNVAIQTSAFVGLRGRGSETTPTYPLAGDFLGVFVARDSINGLGMANYGGVAVEGIASENFSAANKGSFMRFLTTPDGTANPMERMRITASGDMGIGTASPVGRLDINSPVALLGNMGFLNPAIGSMWYDGGSDGTFTISNTSTLDTGFTEFRRNIGGVVTTLLHIHNDGKVGIGTEAPLYRLDVKPSSDTSIMGVRTAGVAPASQAGLILGTLDNGQPLAPGNGAKGWEIYGRGNGWNPAIDGTQPNALGFSYMNGAIWNNAVSILPSGNVGIGTTTPGYKLDVQGGDINASGSVRASGVALSSDLRFKRNIKNIENPLEKVLRLRGVKYEWRTDEFPDRHFDNRPQIGVIAQEVEQEFPELVSTDQKGFKSVNYPALISPVLEAVKEVYNSCQIFENRLFALSQNFDLLKAENAVKEKEILALKKENDQIKAYLCDTNPRAPFCR